MLEYIYTNRVKDMLGLSADEVIKLLALANGENELVLRLDRNNNVTHIIGLNAIDRCIARRLHSPRCRANQLGNLPLGGVLSRLLAMTTLSEIVRTASVLM